MTAKTPNTNDDNDVTGLLPPNKKKQKTLMYDANTKLSSGLAIIAITQKYQMDGNMKENEIDLPKTGKKENHRTRNKYCKKKKKKRSKLRRMKVFPNQITFV